MKINKIRYSSANGEIWAMATFKVKYYHRVFNNIIVRKTCLRLLEEALINNKINYEKIGFDEDHVHILLELGLYSKPDLAKKLRSYIGRKIFIELPWLKKRYFWDSGFWNPAYDIRSHNFSVLSRYIDKQKYAYTGQKTLTFYTATRAEGEHATASI